MTIAVIGSIFVDIKGYPSDIYISQGRNAGRVEQVHGGVGRNVAADISGMGFDTVFISLVDYSGMGEDVIRKLNDCSICTESYFNLLSYSFAKCFTKLAKLFV